MEDKLYDVQDYEVNSKQNESIDCLLVLGAQTDT